MGRNGTPAREARLRKAAMAKVCQIVRRDPSDPSALVDLVKANTHTATLSLVPILILSFSFT